MEQDLKSLLIVAQDSELQSDIEIKLDIWKQKGWKIRYEQYQHLFSWTPDWCPPCEWPVVDITENIYE